MSFSRGAVLQGVSYGNARTDKGFFKQKVDGKYRQTNLYIRTSRTPSYLSCTKNSCFINNLSIPTRNPACGTLSHAYILSSTCGSRMESRRVDSLRHGVETVDSRSTHCAKQEQLPEPSACVYWARIFDARKARVGPLQLITQSQQQRKENLKKGTASQNLILNEFTKS